MLKNDSLFFLLIFLFMDGDASFLKKKEKKMKGSSDLIFQHIFFLFKEVCFNFYTLFLYNFGKCGKFL